MQSYHGSFTQGKSHLHVVRTCSRSRPDLHGGDTQDFEMAAVDIRLRPDPPKPIGQAAEWFGYVHEHEPATIEFEGGRASPAQNYSEIQAWVSSHSHIENQGSPQGTLYPPIAGRARLDHETGTLTRIPTSEYPALIHPVPASHALELTLTGMPSNIRERRLGIAGFVVHLIGYLYDTRLQFHDWSFDAPVPIGGAYSLASSPVIASDFISRCLAQVHTWPTDRQRFITNLLYMHCRARSYRWHWERFMAEYLVTDACYRLAEKLGKVRAKGHAQRIQCMCARFGVRNNEATIKRIVQRRNGLFHEALWEGDQPSGDGSGGAMADVYALHGLNQRLICAILGYRNQFVEGAWDTIDPCGFDKEVRDFQGLPTRLNDQSLARILQHPEMTALRRAIARVLQEPQRVVQPLGASGVRLYYRFYPDTLVGGKYVCVSVRLREDDAYVLTAYLTDKPKQGIQLWPTNE